MKRLLVKKLSVLGTVCNNLQRDCNDDNLTLCPFFTAISKEEEFLV